MRRLKAAVLAALGSAAPALADPSPHDARDWGQLLEAARQHGGSETRLDKSSSYVFRQQNGDFVTLTQWRKPEKHFVCVIAQDQKATVCVNWETGRTTYGERADAASPWKTREATPLEATQETTPAGNLLKHLGDLYGDTFAHIRWVLGRGRATP